MYKVLEREGSRALHQPIHWRRQRQHLGWRGREATRGSVLKPLALDWLLEIQTETAGRPGVSVT